MEAQSEGGIQEVDLYKRIERPGGKALIVTRRFGQQWHEAIITALELGVTCTTCAVTNEDIEIKTCCMRRLDCWIRRNH